MKNSLNIGVSCPVAVILQCMLYVFIGASCLVGACSNAWCKIQLYRCIASIWISIELHCSRCVGWSLPRFGNVWRRRQIRRFVVLSFSVYWMRKAIVKRNRWRLSAVRSTWAIVFKCRAFVLENHIIVMIFTRASNTLFQTFVRRAQWGESEKRSQLFIVYVCCSFMLSRLRWVRFVGGSDSRRLFQNPI